MPVSLFVVLELLGTEFYMDTELCPKQVILLHGIHELLCMPSVLVIDAFRLQCIVCLYMHV